MMRLNALTSTQPLGQTRSSAAVCARSLRNTPRQRAGTRRIVRAASSEDKLRGAKNWEELLPGPNRQLDHDLAATLLRYGDLAQVVNDNFITKKTYTSNMQVAGSAKTLGNDFGSLKNMLADPFGRPRWLANEKKAGGREHSALFNCLEASATGADRYHGIEDIFAYAGQKDVEPQAFGDEDDDQKYPAWQGYAAELRKSGNDEVEEIVFVYRGTLRGAEWDTNWMLQQVPYDHKRPELGKVHKGFLNMYAATVTKYNENDDIRQSPKEVVEKVLQPYKDGKAPVPRITTTGHSLGAALATMSAFHIADFMGSKLKDPVVAYAYASPRVGDHKFRKAYNNSNVKVLRVVNCWDGVTMVPFGWDSAGFGEDETASYSEFLQEVQDAYGPDAKDQYEAFLQQFAPDGSGGQLMPFSWSHIGTKLEFNSLKEVPVAGQKHYQWRHNDPVKLFGSFHNLEMYLHMVGEMPKTPIQRDWALLNKDGNYLADTLARSHQIPDTWWNPGPRHTGLVLKPGQGYRRPDRQSM